MKHSYSCDMFLDYSWNFVTSLFWSRYPNPYSKHVIAEDVVERRILPDGRMYTKRLILKSALSIPRWIRMYTPVSQEYVVEESVVDPQSQRMESLTKNVGVLTKYARLFERCVYTPAGAMRTQVHKNAWTTSDWSHRHIANQLQNFLIYRYQGNAQKAHHGYEFVCNLYAKALHPVQLNHKVARKAAAWVVAHTKTSDDS